MAKVITVENDGVHVVDDKGAQGVAQWWYSPDCMHLAEKTHAEILALPAADLEKIHAKIKK